MTDLLVKLYDLPDPGRQLAALGARGVRIRPAMAYEKHGVVGWVGEHFGRSWASECDVAFGRQPISCHVATRDGRLLGFACFDATCRGFFGPVGVDAAVRAQGTGTGLLLAALHAMAGAGYAYAVVGAVEAPEFYVRAVGATPIPGSSPGIYRDRLRE